VREIPTARDSNEADGELIDENTTQVGAVSIADRRIPVYQRQSRGREQQKADDLKRPDNLVQAGLYGTHCRYDGGSGEIREAAITEASDQIERTPSSAP
jgi:hypothetical protein